MSWRTLNITRSKGPMRLVERPLVEHIVDALNDLEVEYGAVHIVHMLEHKEDEYAELIVKTER